MLRSGYPRSAGGMWLLEQSADQAFGHVGDATTTAGKAGKQAAQVAGITADMLADLFRDHRQQQLLHAARLLCAEPYITGELSAEDIADVAEDAVRSLGVLRLTEQVEHVIQTEPVVATDHLFHAVGRRVDRAMCLLFVQAELAHQCRSRLALQG